MEASTWANSISAGSLVVAVLALLLAWNSRKKAEEAGSAADRSAQAQERMAKALELQAIANAKEQTIPTAAWAVRGIGGDAFELENVGTGAAFDVTIDVEKGVWLEGAHADELHHVAPGDVVKFFARMSLAASDDRLTVTWAQDDDLAKRYWWKRSLPPQ